MCNFYQIKGLKLKVQSVKGLKFYKIVRIGDGSHLMQQLVAIQNEQFWLCSWGFSPQQNSQRETERKLERRKKMEGHMETGVESGGMLRSPLSVENKERGESNKKTMNQGAALR